MTRRDQERAAPAPGPDGPPFGWPTEESVAEPDPPPPAIEEAPGVPSTPAEAAPPVEPLPAVWLASAEGLIPPHPVGGDPPADLPSPGTWAVDPAPGPFELPPPGTSSPGRASPGQASNASAGRPRPVYDGDDPYGRRMIPGPAPVAPFDIGGPADRPYDPDWDRGPATPRARRRVPWGRLFISFVLGLLLSGLVAGGAIYAYEQQYADRILPNVQVGSVDVSGLTRAAARDRLAASFAGLGRGFINVILGGTVTQIPYAEVTRRVDVDAMVDTAFAVGRDPSPVDRMLHQLRMVRQGVTVQPAVILDAARLRQRVDEIARAGEWDPVDATAAATPTGFVTTPARAGQVVDEGTAADDAAQALASLDAPQAIDISLTATPVPPAVTDASAQIAVHQAALMDHNVVLQDGSDTWLIPAGTVHGWLSFTVINNRVRIVIDVKAALARLKPLAKEIDRPAANATMKVDGTSFVVESPSVEGRTFNASKTTTAVVNGLRNRALGSLAVDAPIQPVLARTEPGLTTEEATAAIPLMAPISSWTTNYQPSERNGNGANIRIPTATINGYVVAPGETFSFWKAVGPVTKELGYTAGGAIIDGHTEPQGAIGGGICTCSTTLFNAALRAGFAMGDRLNHFYYINRYPLGLDATVFISASGQAQDMTWTNDTDYPVIISGINGKSSVKFVLYSVPNGRTTTFSDPIVKNYTKATTETKVDTTIPKGTKKQIEYATDGQDVWVTRTVTDSAGVVIHTNQYYSHYATITGIILTNP